MINILKLLVLVPLLWFFCMILGGHLWWVWMIGALALGWSWFKAEQGQKQKKADLEQQVVVTRQNMMQAAIDAQAAKLVADQRAHEARIEAAVQRGVEQARTKHLKGQWN